MAYSRVTLAAVLLATSPAVAQVQWRVTPEDVRLACQALRLGLDPDGVAVEQTAKRFCNLSLGGWDAWAADSAQFPTGDDVLRWANIARKNAQQAIQEAQEKTQSTTTVVISPLVTQAGQTDAAQRSLLTESAILLGLTDFLVERTESEIRAWLLPRFYSTSPCGASATRWRESTHRPRFARAGASDRRRVTHSRRFVGCLGRDRV